MRHASRARASPLRAVGSRPHRTRGSCARPCAGDEGAGWRPPPTLVSKNANDEPTAATDRVPRRRDQRDRWAAGSRRGQSDAPRDVADADKLRTRDPAQEPDGDVVQDHLELSAGLEASFGADRSGDHHAACFINGSLHTIRLPRRTRFLGQGEGRGRHLEAWTSTRFSGAAGDGRIWYSLGRAFNLVGLNA